MALTIFKQILLSFNKFNPFTVVIAYKWQNQNVSLN